ncbi:hypothetical protein CYLTODRAFT_418744 [Cylindrobasidium torrendii FP15055 ss-10]|uniref:Putative gamma-glutamylcyclotransferase n=1 Tax=Cylindrobasidium torrendii FP15055 ss-10 TaxID=1314674 RepID=A0A0D7BLS2_9AGAR|nr:hypothetical protein CYLTODRAFT_418744 [Cylindrobasidium torrendii FP15055 ss-10]
MASSDSRSAFFYGTLMHPKILTEVIQNKGSHLAVTPAVLLDHTRHAVKYADYPGVIPVEKTKAQFERLHNLTRDEGSVRGTLVTGLTASDMKFLDEFEGDEYNKQVVEVHPLGDPEPIDLAIDDKSLIPAHPPPLPQPDELRSGVPAEVYIYADATNLEAQLWSLEDFVRDKAKKWYSGPVESRWS